MSTRASYEFFDEPGDESCRVYIHCDGYPTGAMEHIRAGLDYAWELPRFEAADFSAAVIAAARKIDPETPRFLRGGAAYIIANNCWHGDLAFVYTITKRDKELWVTAHHPNDHGGPGELLHEGTLDDMEAWAKKDEAEG